VVVLTKNNYIKRLKSNAFKTQKRGGKGITTATKEDDEIFLVIPTMNHSDLLYFTTKGRVFTLPAYEIPETTRIAKGQPIINLMNLQKDEAIAAILDIIFSLFQRVEWWKNLIWKTWKILEPMDLKSLEYVMEIIFHG
jgi:DNA gyrase subunit A